MSATLHSLGEPSPEIWTIRKVLAWTTQHFEKRNIEAPRLTAEVLLAHSLATTRVRLYADFERPLQPTELSTYRALIAKRVCGEPTQYLTGHKDFYNRLFQVDARVLIPRPETELLLESALQEIPKDIPTQLLDVCTGSGCIAVTLAAERPLSSVWATDVSPGACEVAKSNAEKHQVSDRVTVVLGDLFSSLPPTLRFDVILSNPPYLRTEEIASLEAHVRREPVLALDGGGDGLTVLKRLISDASSWLQPGGLLGLETAETQGPQVLALLEQAGWTNARIVKDFERRDRFAFARARKD